MSGKTSTDRYSLCTGCEVCIQVCPYSAIALNDKARAEVNPALYKGCGLCCASCRSGAAMLDGSTDTDIFAQICAVSI